MRDRKYSSSFLASALEWGEWSSSASASASASRHVTSRHVTSRHVTSRHVPSALCPRERTSGTHWIGRWVGLRDGCRKNLVSVGIESWSSRLYSSFGGTWAMTLGGAALTSVEKNSRPQLMSQRTSCTWILYRLSLPAPNCISRFDKFWKNFEVLIRMWMSSGMLRRPVWHIRTDVSEVLTASILRMMSKHRHDDGGTKPLWNVCQYQPCYRQHAGSQEAAIFILVAADSKLSSADVLNPPFTNTWQYAANIVIPSVQLIVALYYAQHM
jgi:hypothetical protein